MEVHIGNEQFFVNPVAGSLWVLDLDAKTSRVVVEGTGPDDTAAQFHGGTATFAGAELLVVLPVRRGPTKDEQARIVDLLHDHIAQAPVAFVVKQADGRAVVEISGHRHELVSRAAAAVAVMKASWAWDDSPNFDITVNGHGYAVVAAYDGKCWLGDVTQS